PLTVTETVYRTPTLLLKKRRSKVRARRRTLNLLSYGVLAAASLAVGAVAISAESRSVQHTAGGLALGGVGLGTGLQIGALMQEDVATIDDKVRHLQSIYDAMVERVRVLAVQPQSDQNDAAIGSAIETFIN